MKMRTTVCLVVLFVGYGVFLHAARARAQAVMPGEPAVPAIPPMPVIATMPAVPAIPSMAMLTMPAMPAMPAMSAIPAVPAVPDWGFGDLLGGSTHYRDEPVENCSDLHIRLRDEKPIMESEERTVSKGEARVLRVHEIENGGVQMQGWDKDTYSVTACKAAAGSTEEAHRLISQIKLSIQGGEVSVSGPASHHDDWTVYLLIRTPKAADIELTTHNGPAGFFNVDGKITARATNGPISVKDCSGEADISAQNGPISFSGTSGKLRLHTENGPISVDLNSSTWTGAGLVADAVNGPLTLRVPSGFQSSFLIESSEHSPMSCQASLCSDTRRTWDDDHRRIEYGSGAPVIRLSTKNGPISVL